MKTKTAVSVTALLLLLNISAFPQDKKFYIFICFGQSNMEGNARIEHQDTIADNRFVE